VARIHARAAYCFKLLLGQLRSGEAAAAFAKALELLIFIGTDEIAGDLAVARDGNRLTAGIRGAGKTPLFRSAVGKTGRLTDNPMHRVDAYQMIRRRTAEAGFKIKLGCHVFRATGITAYLEAGGTLENAQAMAAHESPRTTKLY
jgi:integrase